MGSSKHAMKTTSLNYLCTWVHPQSTCGTCNVPTIFFVLNLTKPYVNVHLGSKREGESKPQTVSASSPAVNQWVEESRKLSLSTESLTPLTLHSGKVDGVVRPSLHWGKLDGVVRSSLHCVTVVTRSVSSLSLSWALYTSPIWVLMSITY